MVADSIARPDLIEIRSRS